MNAQPDQSELVRLRELLREAWGYSADAPGWTEMDGKVKAALKMAEEHRDEHGIHYVTPEGERYHYVWCHDCGGDGCDYCEGTGQVRIVDKPAFDEEEKTR